MGWVQQRSCYRVNPARSYRSDPRRRAQSRSRASPASARPPETSRTQQGHICPPGWESAADAPLGVWELVWHAAGLATTKQRLGAAADGFPRWKDEGRRAGSKGEGSMIEACSFPSLMGGRRERRRRLRQQLAAAPSAGRRRRPLRPRRFRSEGLRSGGGCHYLSLPSLPPIARW